MWVKICGNTNADDALRAAALGADAVGFVFASSVRRVTAQQVAEVTARLPPTIQSVGVFAGHDAETIAQTAVQAGLTAVQMHGGVDLQLAARVRERLGPAVEIIHTVHWTLGEDENSALRVRRQLQALEDGERVLVDAKVGSRSGGLGLRFDWAAAREVLMDFSRLKLIIAGGLNPANVAEAVQTLQPYGVDVASGVERVPGSKDSDKLRDFIENARRGSSLGRAVG
jgi:phosphoribosylanthranilate isomerase